MEADVVSALDSTFEQPCHESLLHGEENDDQRKRVVEDSRHGDIVQDVLLYRESTTKPNYGYLINNVNIIINNVIITIFFRLK